MQRGWEGCQGAGRGLDSSPRGPALPRPSAPVGRAGVACLGATCSPAPGCAGGSGRSREAGGSGRGPGQACGSPGSVLQGSDLTAEAFQCFPPEEPPRVLFVLLAGLGSGQRARRGHGRKGLEDRRQPPGLSPLSGEEPRRGDSRGHGQVRDGLGFELGSSRCPEDTGPFPAHLPSPPPPPPAVSSVSLGLRGMVFPRQRLETWHAGHPGGLESEPQGNWTSLATPYLRVQTRRL